MNEVAEVTLYISVLASAVVAGGQLFCLLAVIPAFGDLSSRAGVALHQHGLTERPHRYLRVVSPIALFAGIATIAIEHSGDGAVIASAIGLPGAIFNGVYSQREWPINDEINEMGESPTDEQVQRYLTLRKLWDQQHRVRTMASISSFAAFAAAAAFF